MLLSGVVESMKKDWHRPANLISSFRLLFAGVPAILLLVEPTSSVMRWAATLAFAVVALTDAADGYVARHYNQVTEWGKFLDPLVDKVLVAATLVGLSIVYPYLWFVTAFILLREVVVTIQIRSKDKVVAAIWSGKVKMTVQVAMIIAWLIPGGQVWFFVQLAVTIAAVVVTAWSWIDYYRRFVKN